MSPIECLPERRELFLGRLEYLLACLSPFLAVRSRFLACVIFLDGWLECPASCFLAIWSPCLAGGISLWLEAVVRCEAAGVVWVVL